MLTILLVFLSLFGGRPAVAQGTSVKGGGDLCEDRIKLIRDDIASWIKQGGHKQLILGTNVTSLMYEQKMMGQIAKAQIICVSKGDPGHPVVINQIPKVCRFDQGSDHSRITCDSMKLSSILPSEQYTLIHHEFAGLAGLEMPDGADSNYSISNQISGYLEDNVVKRLAVKKIQEFAVDIIPNPPVRLLSWGQQRMQLVARSLIQLMRAVRSIIVIF